MSRVYSILALLCFAVLVVGCRKESHSTPTKDDIEWHEHTIAVVLPMEGGMDKCWMRTLDWVTKNLERAFANQQHGIRIKYELYDESSENLEVLSKSLCRRSDVMAVVGGINSQSAQKMASVFAKYKKVFMTLATNNNLIRAYSDAHLWAMVESDITACEIMLSKVMAYRGKSVALLVDVDDNETKTYVDWFSFLAKEMGLENGGIIDYDPDNVFSGGQQAAAADVDFIICAPSRTNDIGNIIDAFKVRAAQNLHMPRILFSDMAYGLDVLSELGDMSEGIEGVTYCADPESGFDVTYNVFFGEMPTLGESHVYDAVMMLGYAFWYQQLNPGVSLNNAIKAIVDGKEPIMGGWLPENMLDVVDALARGGHPDISGSSGALDFDSVVYTSVLSTTYCHYMVYNGQYISLDYNTSHGGYRTDATLANWNRLKEQMEDVEYTPNKISYPPLEDKWALLVAGSNGWSNYRFQADVLAMYQLLKSVGYTDDHIVLIMEDDIAYNVSNPFKGIVQVAIGGDNLYTDVQVDYHLSDIRPEDIKPILLGQKSEHLPEVIGSTSNDNIFVFWSGHGYKNQLCWAENHRGLTSSLVGEILHEMDSRDNFRKQIWFVESCYSGSVLEVCQGVPGVLAFTAADANETSKADIFNSALGVWLSNQFTYTLRTEITNCPSISLYNLYRKLFVNTLGSHVMIYNEDNYGNVITNTMEEFL